MSNQVRDVIVAGLLKTLNDKATKAKYQYVGSTDATHINFELLVDGQVKHRDSISMMENLPEAIERLVESRKQYE